MRDDRVLNRFIKNLGQVGRKLLTGSAANKPAEPVILRPHGKERGSVSISYITWPLCDGWDSPKARGHTNAFEVVAIAEAWRDLGFRVEACNYNERSYQPPEDCVVAIDLHSNLERWEDKLPPECVKILHATGCHWRIHNKAELDRIAALQRRRGILLQPRRQVAPSRAAEIAEQITVLGNEYTIETYAYFGKPITRIPISSAYEFEWPKDKDFEEAKRRFLWLGSYGMVHKGLDLVLEAFAGMPDLHLTVCGRPEKEPDFFDAYKKELTQLPNITLRGWVDPASPDFKDIAATHGTIISPSACEGGGGAVIHCMHAGLLPACSPEASIDLCDFGIRIHKLGVAAVAASAQQVVSLPGGELMARARSAYDHVRQYHTRETFSAAYRAFAAGVSVNSQ